MKFREITLMSIAIVSFSSKEGKLPVKVNLESRSYNKNVCGYILAKAVSQIGRDVDFTAFASAPTPYKGSFEKTLTKTEYLDVSKRLYKYIEQNKRVPNYVGYKDKKISFDTCIFSLAKIVKYYKDHNRMPNTCLFTFPTVPTKVTIGKLTDKLQKKLGVTIKDYKTLYRAFNNAVYKYYYDDQKSQSSAISSLRTGLNCVDLNQLAYYSLKEMGYTVKIVRGTVRCSDGTYGHVWCRLKIGNEWIHFDASASAKGKPLGSVICGSVVSITNTDPSWLLSDDGRT